MTFAPPSITGNASAVDATTPFRSGDIAHFHHHYRHRKT
jgi:hypothetical protein